MASAGSAQQHRLQPSTTTCPPACTRTPAPHLTALARVRLQYGLNFYLDYLAKWPEYCQMAVGPAQQAMGYSE